MVAIFAPQWVISKAGSYQWSYFRGRPPGFSLTSIMEFFIATFIPKWDGFCTNSRVVIIVMIKDGAVFGCCTVCHKTGFSVFESY